MRLINALSRYSLWLIILFIYILYWIPSLLHFIFKEYPEWFLSACIIFICLLINTLVIVCKKRLICFRIDRFVLIFLFLAQFFDGLFILILQKNILFSVLLWVIIIITIYTIRTDIKYLPIFNKFHVKYLFIGFSIVIVIQFLQALDINYRYPLPTPPPSGYPFYNSIINTFYLIWKGVYEEFLYRGFFWGMMLKIGWSQKRVWFVSSILMWLTHILLLPTKPFVFFFFTSSLILLLGYLRKKTNSLTLSVIVHSFTNGCLEIMNVLASRVM